MFFGFKGVILLRQGYGGQRAQRRKGTTAKGRRGEGAKGRNGTTECWPLGGWT